MSGAMLAMTQLISLDGVVELDDTWVGAAGPEAQSAFADSMAAEQAFLLGRRSYEEFSAYWPSQTGRDDDTGAMSRHLEQVPKYVVSRTLTNPSWGGTTILTGDPAEVVRELKQKLGTGTLGLNGSLTLSHALLAAGLVDETRLYLVPATADRGATLSGDSASAHRFRLIDSTVLDGGIVRLVHRLSQPG